MAPILVGRLVMVVSMVFMPAPIPANVRLLMAVPKAAHFASSGGGHAAVQAH